ncbi:undecaprenyl-phosphate alpha-N-acetylglucosaminyl 1-phosphate transferase [Thalassotalea sp. G20_0]|uniref:undecaprenyl-phosphate alpha-N-acetylglucosaminyl 1-phosphate transferase n=1 Tax=Thalassotalea sp. G20_0 TaxID=2821093 RepID=UPI001ADBACF9|nr:undecaprenyl-phosphate alpha-N-acetylglucosaminyl 1-phosphate transferase [Thalassotalea sp. G20_0]MBO9496931.1 undecaprenyl-phosphate alpha-N-acetylglucosaminyl 1-phosphate transferase [Thalassotalea sp. G20_0]
MELTIFKALAAFALSFGLIKLLKPVSRKIGLVDKPDERKHHESAVPLIGGLVIYLTLLILGMLFVANSTALIAYYISAGMLTLVGVFDDRFNISVRLRILATFIAAGIMMYFAGTIFTNLGNMFGLGDVVMPIWLAVPFTLIAAFGIVNCMNMIDGIDGLSSGIAIIAVASILITLDFTTRLKAPIIVFIAAILAFQVFNLQLSSRLHKVFMGDAGSMMIGFTLIMMICYCTQATATRGPRFEAVTGLYFLGLPLIDMVSTVLRRMKKGKNPFKPDRTHAHHIFMLAGFSPRQTLVIMLCIAALINGMGILLNELQAPAWLQFGLFILLFVFYFQGIQHGFKLSHLLQKVHGERVAS